MSRDSMQEFAGLANGTLRLAANAYNGHSVAHTGHADCSCSSPRLLTPDSNSYDHVDSLRREVERLGARQTEPHPPKRPPLKIDLLIGDRGPTSYSLITSTDSGTTWGLPLSLGDTIGGLHLFSPDKDVRCVFAIGTNQRFNYRIWDGLTDWGWKNDSLGPDTNQTPAILMSDDGTFDIFLLARNKGQIKHSIWNSHSLATGNFVSPAWQVIGSEPSPESAPAAVSRGPSLMDVFMVSGGSLYWKSWSNMQWQPSPTGFKKISNCTNTTKTKLNRCTGDPVAVSRHRSRIDVFVLNAAGNLVYHDWDGQDWEEHNLGGDFASIPAVVARTQDRLHVFILGRDGKLYHKSVGKNPWRRLPAKDEFDCMGGCFATNIPPTVVDSREGMDIFAVGGKQAGGMLYHRRWDGMGIPPTADEFRRLNYWDVKHRVAALVREQAREPEKRGNWFIT